MNLDINQYPAIKRYLARFGRRLEQAGEKFIDSDGVERKTRKKTGNNWFETQDQIAYHQEFEKEKVIYPNMTKYLPFYLDNNKFFTNQKCFIMTGQNLGYLTALFNSQLFKFVFREKFPVLMGGTRELSKIFFDKLRIPKIDFEREHIFYDLVTSTQKRVEKDLPTSEIEEKINQLLYDMCDLNKKEREIINSYEL